jgi:murein DD-endopeptidase MepM/ murein hydrolase activator NlpD
MQRRTVFVAVVLAVLLLAPAVALLRGGGDPKPARAVDSASARPVPAAGADVPLSGEDARPLPRPRPKLVEPVAGQTGAEAGDAGEGVALATDAVPSGRGDRGISPGAPSDAEVRSELTAMRRSQARIQALLASGRYPAAAFGTGRVNWPLPRYNQISSPFGPRWGRLHAGVDVPAPVGTPIYAADSGVVRLAGPTGGYGNYVCIQHTRTLSTCYAHQSRILVRAGRTVRAGQVIGLTGNTGFSTGPHLHFETRVNGVPQDPLRFL